MYHHFENFLNVGKLIEDNDPAWILELGAGGGDNTHKLLDTGRKIIVVSDGEIPSGDECRGNLTWIYGLSYLEIPKLPGIPFAIVDTDHNGWTLDRELTLLEGKMIPPGIVCIHDTVSFSEKNGYAMRYMCGEPYDQEILDCKMTYTGALEAHLSKWKVIGKSKESCGAIALKLGE